MRRIVILLLAFVVHIAPAAAQDARMAHAERIAKALGLVEGMQSVQRLQVESARQQVEATIDQLKKAGVNERVVAQVTAWGDGMAQKVATAWDPKEAGRIYAEGLAQVMSEEELAAAETYYASDEGRKAYTAIEASMRKTMDYIESKTGPVMQAEMAAFFAQLKQLTDKSKEARKP